MELIGAILLELSRALFALAAQYGGLELLGQLLTWLAGV
jgi:hypothetical protein